MTTNTDVAMPELPGACPFCGNLLTFKQPRHGDDYFEHPKNECVLAGDGFIADPLTFYATPAAISQWNRRACLATHTAELARPLEVAAVGDALTGDAVVDLVREAGLDWHAGFNLDDENRYGTLVRLAFDLGASQRVPVALPQEPVGHFIENFGETGRWQQSKTEMPGITRPLYATPAPKQGDAKDAEWLAIDEALINEISQGGCNEYWLHFENGNICKGSYQWRQGRSPDRFFGDMGDIPALGGGITHIMRYSPPAPPSAAILASQATAAGEGK